MLLYATISASVALSIVSAYETYLGLLDFMSDSLVGSVASGILTFGVQVLLFVISWSIAEHIREGFRANAARWAIWVLCAFFSGYFSYFGFLETTGGRDEDIRQPAITAEIGEVLQTVEVRLSTSFDNNHNTNLLENPEYQNRWVTDSLREMIALADGAEDLIAQAARVARDQNLRDKQALQAQLETLQTDLRDATIVQRLFESDIERTQQAYEAAAGRLAEIEDQARTADLERTELEARLEQELQTGDGPRASAIRIDVNSQLAEVEGLQAQREALIAEVNTLEEQRIANDIALETGLEAQRVIELQSAVDAVEVDIAAIDRQLSESTEGVSFDFDEQRTLLDNSLTGLVAKDYSQFDALLAQCNQIEIQLSNAGLAGQVQDIECSNPEVALIITDLRSQQEALATYRDTCLNNTDALTPSGSESGAGMPLYNSVIAFATSCMDAEPDRAMQSELVARLNTLQKQRGDNVDPITMASVALFQDRQGNAVMSAIFAVIVDVLVLLCALVGRNVGLPERVRGIDQLLKLGRPYRGDKPSIEKTINLAGLDTAKRAAADSVINDLLRADLVEFDDDVGDVLLLKRGATSRLTKMRQQDIRENSDILDTRERSRGPIRVNGGARRRR